MNVEQILVGGLVITVVLTFLVIIFALDFGPYWNKRMYRWFYKHKSKYHDWRISRNGDNREYCRKKVESYNDFLHKNNAPKFLNDYYEYSRANAMDLSDS